MIESSAVEGMASGATVNSLFFLSISHLSCMWVSKTSWMDG